MSRCRQHADAVSRPVSWVWHQPVVCLDCQTDRTAYTKKPVWCLMQSTFKQCATIRCKLLMHSKVLCLMCRWVSDSRCCMLCSANCEINHYLPTRKARCAVFNDSSFYLAISSSALANTLHLTACKRLASVMHTQLSLQWHLKQTALIALPGSGKPTMPLAVCLKWKRLASLDHHDAP